MLTIGDVAKDVFYGTRAKRVYVKSKEHGIPFLSSSDILQADLSNVKLASKKYTPAIEQMTLQKGWILVSRSGTIGNTAWTSGVHAQKLASEDVIRIAPNDILRGGLVYAYLSTSYGHSLLTQGTFGAVIQHIEPDFVRSIPIPRFPAAFEAEVDTLIRESARLREEAQEAKEKAHMLIHDYVKIPDYRVSNKVSIKTIVKSHTTRFEGAYYVSENRQTYDYITSHFACVTLKDYAKRIFRPGIFKRDYVENGVMFLGGADIMMAIPNSDKHLSYRQVNNMPELKVERGWILISCGGTIGNVVYIDEQLAKCVISQHVMRLVPKDNKDSYFLYAFLSSTIGYKLINEFTYGAVIPSLESHHLNLVPIPQFENKQKERISDLMKVCIENIEKAKELENRAITMVEEAISGWQ